MRVVGVLLVLLGAVALGYQGFTYAGADPAGTVQRLGAPEAENRVWGPPVVGGVAIVAGLLMLVPRRRPG